MRTFLLAPTILKGLIEGLRCGKILRLELGLGWGLVWMVRVWGWRMYYAYDSPHKDRYCMCVTPCCLLSLLY